MKLLLLGVMMMVMMMMAMMVMVLILITLVYLDILVTRCNKAAPSCGQKRPGKIFQYSGML